jgi:hypothetical protein
MLIDTEPTEVAAEAGNETITIGEFTPRYSLDAVN